MKKIYLFALVATLIACQEDITEIVESTAEFDKQETIVLDGLEVTLNYMEVNGKRRYEESDNLKTVRNLIHGDDVVLMINSEIDAPLLFSNEEIATQFSKNLSAIESLHNRFGSIQESSDNIIGVSTVEKDIQGVANKSGNLSFTISRTHSLLAPAYTINVISRWSTRHLLRNQCITGGIDFDNEISSLYVNPGLDIQFHEDPDYKGNLLWISAISQPLYIANLTDLKKTYTRIMDGTLTSGQPCGWICTSWNDKITAVNAFQGNLYPTPRNTSNTCPQ